MNVLRRQDRPATGRVERSVPRLFLLLALVLGVPSVFLNPPLQAPDEFAHFYRAYGVSEGQLVAHGTTPVPRALMELIREFPSHLERVHRVRKQILIAFARQPLQEWNATEVSNEGMGMYSFVPYLSTGAALRLGRSISLSPLGLLYLGRLANLITYALLVYMALRVLPDFRLLLLCLALVPTALSQAGSLSIDAVTFSVAFLLSAYLLKLAFDPAVTRIEPKHQAILALLVMLGALCKADVILLLLAVLIPPGKFSSVRARFVSLGAYAVLAGSVAAGWNLINAHNLKLWEMARLRLGISLAGNWQFVWQHPLLFGEAMGRTLCFHAFDYLDNFVSTVGWLAASIPAWVVCMYLALLLVVALTQTRRVALKAGHKAVLLGISLLGGIAAFVMLWGFETPESYIRGNILLGQGHIPGVEGRYFIPFALPLFVLFSNARLRLSSRWVRSAAVLMICTASGADWITMHHTYYEPGDMVALESHLVRKPGGSVEDEKVYWIENGQKRWVTTAQWIAARGLRWPDDVTMVKAKDLDAMPSGPNLP